MSFDSLIAYYYYYGIINIFLIHVYKTNTPLHTSCCQGAYIIVQDLGWLSMLGGIAGSVLQQRKRQVQTIHGVQQAMVEHNSLFGKCA